MTSRNIEGMHFAVCVQHGEPHSFIHNARRVAWIEHHIERHEYTCEILVWENELPEEGQPIVARFDGTTTWVVLVGDEYLTRDTFNGPFTTTSNRHLRYSWDTEADAKVARLQYLQGQAPATTRSWSDAKHGDGDAVNWAWRCIRWEDRSPEPPADLLEPEDVDLRGHSDNDAGRAAAAALATFGPEHLESDQHVTVGGMVLRAYAFRAWDDDQHGVALGWFIGDSDDESAFAPLAYLQRHYGHTEIHYLRDGKWEQL